MPGCEASILVSQKDRGLGGQWPRFRIKIWEWNMRFKIVLRVTSV